MTEQAAVISHDEAIDLLPWLLNGSLSDARADAVMQHMRNCMDCRRERRQLEAVVAGVSHDKIACTTPAPNPSEVLARIEAFEESKTRNPFVRLGHLVREYPFLAYAAQAAAILLAVLLFTVPDNRESQFTTLTQAESIPAGSYLRVVFEPGMSATLIKELLNSMELTIVDGPSARGVYTLDVTGAHAAADNAALANELRSKHNVLFSEAVIIGDQP